MIARAPALLGLDARPNSAHRILTETGASLSLAAQSTFNYVPHEDVLQFLRAAWAADARGVYNVAAAERTSLGAIAAAHGRAVRFGEFVYRTPIIDNRAALELAPNLGATSLENIARYYALLDRGDV